MAHSIIIFFVFVIIVDEVVETWGRPWRVFVLLKLAIVIQVCGARIRVKSWPSASGTSAYFMQARVAYFQAAKVAAVQWCAGQASVARQAVLLVTDGLGVRVGAGDVARGADGEVKIRPTLPIISIVVQVGAFMAGIVIVLLLVVTVSPRIVIATAQAVFIKDFPTAITKLAATHAIHVLAPVDALNHVQAMRALLPLLLRTERQEGRLSWVLGRADAPLGVPRRHVLVHELLASCAGELLTLEAQCSLAAGDVSTFADEGRALGRGTVQGSASAELGLDVFVPLQNVRLQDVAPH